MKEKDDSDLNQYPFNGKSPFLIDKIMLIGYDNTFKNRNTPKSLPNLYAQEREVIRQTTDSSPFTKQALESRLTTYEIEKMMIHRSTTTTISYGRQTLESTTFSRDGKKSIQQPELILSEYPTILGEIASDYSKNFLENETIISLIFPTIPKIAPILDKDIDKDNNIEENIIFSFNPITDKTKSSVNGYAYLFYESYESFLWPKVLFFYSEYPYFTSFNELASRIKRSKSKPLEHILFNIIHFTPSPINASISLEGYTNKEEAKSILFPQLSCYPLFNFNLSELFNIMPVRMIIEIFFFTFLEHDIIFFSRNLEVLNLVMFIFSNLNYPCNDSTYYWQILSVSLFSFLTDSLSFCNKPCSCIIGINEAYDPSIQTTSKNKDHFIVDIDNKKIEYKYKEDKANKDEVYKNKAILEYINKAMKSKNSSSYFKRSIAHLYESLRDCSAKITNNSNNTQRTSRIINFFKYDDKIESNNKFIQNIFYSFIVKILHLFTEINSISLTALCDKKEKDENTKPTSLSSASNETKKMFFISLDGAKKELKPEEALIDEKFQQCSKYNQYIVNFNQFQDCIDLYKIPLFITQELISWLNINKEQLQLTFCFKLMDKIYIQSKHKICHINLSELHNDIMEEQMISKNDKEKKRNQAKPFSLKIKMKRLSNYYKYYLNLSEEERNRAYPSYKLIKENSKPSQCTSLSIQEKIELRIIDKNILSKDDLILMSIITVFCLTRETCASGAFFQMTLFKDNFVSNRINLRKYYVLLLNICYRLPKKSPKFLIDNYFLLVNSIRTHDTNVIPNEELLMLLNQADSMIHEISVEAYDFKKQLTNYKLTLDLPKDNDQDKANMSDDYNESDIKTQKAKQSELVLSMPFNPSNTINRSQLYPVMKIYSLVNEMLEAYYQTLDNDFSYDINELKNIVLNLVFYIQILSWKSDNQKRQLTQLMLSILIYVNSKGDCEINKKIPFTLQLNKLN